MAQAKAEAEGLRRAARQQAEHSEVLQRDCTALARKVADVESAVASAPEPMQVGLGQRQGRVEVTLAWEFGMGPGSVARLLTSEHETVRGIVLR
jgi:hypothetical protein